MLCNDVLSGACVASPRIELVSAIEQLAPAVDVRQGHTKRVRRGRGGIAWFIPCPSCVAVELDTCALSISSVASPLNLADVRFRLDCDGCSRQLIGDLETTRLSQCYDRAVRKLWKATDQ